MKFSLKKLALSLLISIISIIPLTSQAMYGIPNFYDSSLGPILKLADRGIDVYLYATHYTVKEGTTLYYFSPSNPLEYILKQIEVDDSKPNKKAYNQTTHLLKECGDNRKWPIISVEDCLNSLAKDNTTLSCKQSEHLGLLILCFAKNNQYNNLKSFIKKAFPLVTSKSLPMEECFMCFKKFNNQKAAEWCINLQNYILGHFEAVENLTDLVVSFDDTATYKKLNVGIENQKDYIANTLKYQSPNMALAIAQQHKIKCDSPKEAFEYVKNYAQKRKNAGLFRIYANQKYGYEVIPKDVLHNIAQLSEKN